MSASGVTFRDLTPSLPLQFTFPTVFPFVERRNSYTPTPASPTKVSYFAYAPQVLLRGHFRGVTPYSFFISNYDVTADGNFFLVNVLSDIAESHPLTVVINWTSLLEENQ